MLLIKVRNQRGNSFLQISSFELVELPRMPKIYFQVASQDGWGRHRTEGYSYLDIPSQPGRRSSHLSFTMFAEILLGFYHENLNCWRPRGDSIFNELRRFFIGGSHELEDINYVAIPKQFESEKVGRTNRDDRKFDGEI